MSADLRRYLPATIACVVIAALIVLGYEAGYHAGKSAATHIKRSAPARP